MSTANRQDRTDTLLTHGGRFPDEHHGFLNTPVTRGSTVLFKTFDELVDGHQTYRYGRRGNPTNRSVETLVTALEGGVGTVLAPSGLAAISVALLSGLSTGDEVLITDSVYGPTRQFATTFLARMGISSRFFDPRIGAGIKTLIGANTRAIFVESPGSLTFEIQDLPAIAGAAQGHGITIIADNTWATPLFHNPLALGADIVVHAGTKMLVGHSDAMFGTITANDKAWPSLTAAHGQMGIFTSPDDAFLAARGLRTLAIRMKEHRQRALDLASWLSEQQGVAAVLHPALRSHPDHALFERDFTGSGSLFSIVLDPGPRTAIAAMVDGMELFGMGYSWGGFESLILPSDPRKLRTSVPWTDRGNLVRIHVGFEDFDDLKTDLSAGLERYRSALV